MQWGSLGLEHVVAYASRKLSVVEREYRSNELQYIGVVWSVDERFCHYLYGRHFTTITYNTSISRTFTEQLKHKFSPWIFTLQDCRYDLRRRLGLKSKVADGFPCSLLHPDTERDPLYKISFSQDDRMIARRSDSYLMPPAKPSRV